MGKILISHRGNIYGKGGNDWENHPDYIQKALDLGYSVEIDIWRVNNKWYLGHDEPKYEIETIWIYNRMINLYLHCKNIEALNELFGKPYFYFWHQNDDYTLTSHGRIWTYPNKPILENCIAVLPELHPDWDISKAIGICSDFISKYK